MKIPKVVRCERDTERIVQLDEDGGCGRCEDEEIMLNGRCRWVTEILEWCHLKSRLDKSDVAIYTWEATSSDVAIYTWEATSSDVAIYT